MLLISRCRWLAGATLMVQCARECPLLSRFLACLIASFFAPKTSIETAQVRGGRGFLAEWRCCSRSYLWYSATMNSNVNDNERESAVLDGAMLLVSPSSRMVPLSKWSVPSLVVLRALELSGVNADVVGAFYPLAHFQAAPVLSVRSHAIKTEPTAMLVEGQVASLVACGAVVDAGLRSHGDGGRAHWSCLRFPVGGHDEKPVIALAREMGSAAQSEMDRRWSEVHPSELS